jgi:HSP20 family protein
MMWRRRRRAFDPFSEFRRMQEMMDEMFASFFEEPYYSDYMLPEPIERMPVERSSYRAPLTDVWEDEKNVYITAELPGIKKEDISVNITERGIEIKAKKKEEMEEKRKGMYRLERTYGGFYKFVALPSNVDVDKAEATYNNGVLEIRIPKKEVKEEGRKLEIK